MVTTRKIRVARKFVLSACILYLHLAYQAISAPIFQDNFDSTHDFIAQGVSNTAWDGMEGRDRAVQASSSLDHIGQLVLSSWEPGQIAVSHQVWLGLTPQNVTLIADGLEQSWLFYEPGFVPLCQLIPK